MTCASCGHPLAADEKRCGKCGAVRPELEPSFARAESAYLRLRREFEAGTLTAERFEAAVEADVIDHDGRYWMLGVESGAWHVHDGETWVRASPPTTAARPPDLRPLQPAEPTRRAPGGSAAALAAMAGFALCLAS